MSNCLLGDLSPDRRWVVEEIHRRRFGRFGNLVIRGGEPQREPRPQIITTWKFASKDHYCPVNVLSF